MNLNSNNVENNNNNNSVVVKKNEPKIHYRKDYKPSGFIINNVTLNINIHDNETIVRSIIVMIIIKGNIVVRK